MRLVRSSPQGLVFRARQLPPPALLMAVAAFVLAALPVIGPSATGLRLVTSLGFATIGLVIAFYALRRQSLTVSLAPNSPPRSEREIRRDEIEAVRLCEAPPIEQDPLPPRYAAELVLKDGSRVLFSVGADPSDVLRDLRELAARVDCPIERGWGLDAHATPWRFEPATMRKAAAAPLSDAVGTSSPRHPKQRTLALIVLLVAALTALDWLLLSVGQVRRGLEIQPVSIWLGGSALVIMITLAAVLWTGQWILKLHECLSVEARHLGIAVLRERRSLESVRAVYLVSPNGDAAHHLLFDTRDGPLAYPCLPSLDRQSAVHLKERLVSRLSH